MAFDPILRTDLIPAELLEDPQQIKVESEVLFEQLLATAQNHGQQYTATPLPAKNIIETIDLIRQVIIDYEKRTDVPVNQRASFVYENPDIQFGKWIELDDNGEPFSPEHTPATVITVGFIERAPGSFSRGSPGEGSVKNRRPILRENTDDPDNPGYKRAVLGYFYDNVIRLTVWNRTNKVANEKALWLENIMEEYMWFFVRSGVNRILFQGWSQNLVFEDNNQRYYGRPIEYFVRTEKLWNISQKTLEEILIRLAVSQT